MTAEPRTLNEVFNIAVERFRADEFLRFKRDGAWQSLTFGELARRVRELALGLVQSGIERGDRIAIWSENRPEWNLADLATLAVGAIDVPIYTTQSLDQVEYILNDSAARALFVSAPFLEKALALKPRLPSLEFIFAFDEPSAQSSAVIRVEEMASAGRALFAEQPGLYVVRPQRFLQQRVVEQVDLADREVIRRPPPRIEQRKLLVVEWACVRCGVAHPSPLPLLTVGAQPSPRHVLVRRGRLNGVRVLSGGRVRYSKSSP